MLACLNLKLLFVSMLEKYLYTNRGKKLPSFESDFFYFFPASFVGFWKTCKCTYPQGFYLSFCLWLTLVEVTWGTKMKFLSWNQAMRNKRSVLNLYWLWISLYKYYQLNCVELKSICNAQAPSNNFVMAQKVEVWVWVQSFLNSCVCVPLGVSKIMVFGSVWDFLRKLSIQQWLRKQKEIFCSLTYSEQRLRIRRAHNLLCQRIFRKNYLWTVLLA